MRVETTMTRRLLGVVVLAWQAACGGSEAVSPGVAATPMVSDLVDREAMAKAEGLLLKRFDLNRDGQPDVFKFYREESDPKNPGNVLEIPVRRESDVNHDGKIDIMRSYDAKQQLSEERTDLDFDGRVDSVATYKDGVIHHTEIDVNYDGRSDITRFFEEGKLARIESDRNNDGKVDTWEYFINGELDRVGTDSDLDGLADAWERKRQTATEEPPPATESAPAADASQKTSP
jgi:hypothetical protein